MREMKDSGIEWIGEIPNDWRVYKVKNICRVRGEKNRPQAQVLSVYRELGVVVKAERNDNHNVTSEDTSSYKYVLPNDLVVNKMKAWQGSMGISRFEGIVSPAYYVFKIISDEIYPMYIHYLLRNVAYLPEYRRLSGGIRPGQWDLSVENLQNIPILNPPYNNQCRIVSYLDRKCSQIDAIIARQQEVIEKLKAYKLSVITEVVTKGLNPDVPMKDSGVEWIGEIPEHWEIRKLKSIVDIISKGTTPSTIGSELHSCGEIRFLKAENIQNDRVVLEPEFYIDKETHSVLKRSQLQENDILFVIAGATIGKTAILSGDAIPANTNQAVSFIRLKEKDDSKYVWYYLQSSYVKTILNLLSVQSAQPNLSMQDMGNFYLCYPSKDERDLITEYLDNRCTEIDSIIYNKEKLVSKLTGYKKSLIYEVVTGKKEV